MLLKNKLKELKMVLNKGNVLTALEERYCYARDALNLEIEIKTPDLVVFVETIEDVQKVLKYANEEKIPVIARGAGTNMVGACVCTEGGIILNFSKMNKIIEINPMTLTAKVQPGVILGDLKDEVEKFNLFYPPDPSNYRVSTVGGSIAQSSGGAKSFKYGTTKDYILSLKVVTADGNLMQLGVETPKDATGYHLAQLMVGSEGTLAIVVEATLKLIPKPERNKTIVAYFDNVSKAVLAVNELISQHIFPASIDFMDNNSITTVEDFMNCGLDKAAKCLLLIELDGSEVAISEQVEKCQKSLLDSEAFSVIIPDTDYESEKYLKARRSSYAAATRLAPDVVSDDIIVPREFLAQMIECCNMTANKYDLKVCVVGHIGDGNIHPQFVLNLKNEEEYRNYKNAKSEIYSYVKNFGGTISAEHGIGLEKKAYMNEIIDQRSLDYMKLIKKIFDPKNILNPGKIF